MKRYNKNLNVVLYVFRIWRKFHPAGSNSTQASNFQFTFPEFVRLVVNGSREFADDNYIMQVIGY